MKIAHVCRSLVRTAGTERFILETSREISRRNIEVRIYTALLNRELFVDTRTSTVERKTVVSKSPFLHFYSDLVIAKHLIDAASSWADAIILDFGTGAADYGWRKYDLPCVPFFHLDKYDRSLFGAFHSLVPIYTYPLRVMESKCIRTIPLAFANSFSLAMRVRRHIKGGRLLVVPLGVDVERYQPTWADAGFVLMAGRFHPANNFELGLRAAINIRCKLIIAGMVEERFSWYYHWLRDLVHSTPELDKRVEFMTPTDEVLLELIQKCSVFLSPRRYDYLGLAALEAMACGKPVIAYDADDDGFDSVTKCGDEVSLWREALSSFLGDLELRKAVGKKSRAFVEHEHTIGKTVDVMLEAIKTSIGVV